MSTSDQDATALLTALSDFATTVISPSTMYERLFTPICGAIAIGQLSLSNKSPTQQQEADADFASACVPNTVTFTVADLDQFVGTAPLATRDEQFYSIYSNPEMVAELSKPHARLHIYDRGSSTAADHATSSSSESDSDGDTHQQCRSPDRLHSVSWGEDVVFHERCLALSPDMDAEERRAAQKRMREKMVKVCVCAKWL